MIKSWLFDVDGTLTPSRQSMPEEFRNWFLQFVRNNEVHLVTGSDYPKTLEQVGPEILAAVTTSFNCIGNSVWKQGVEVHRKPFELPVEALTFLENWLENSQYAHRWGQHIEFRPGMVNFSVVGRGASMPQRAHYYEWDKEQQERVAIARAFEAAFPQLACQIAGETGVDIFPVGRDKSQVLSSISLPVAFFGDRVEKGGNDHSVATAANALGDGSRAHGVTGWQDTWNLLKMYHQKGWISL